MNGRSLVMPDAVLDFWAELYLQSKLPRTMRFDVFIALPAGLRRRKIDYSAGASGRDLQEQLERRMPDALLRGRLVEPVHRGIRGNKAGIWSKKHLMRVLARLGRVR